LIGRRSVHCAQAAPPPFDETVRPRCPRRDLNHGDAVGGEDLIERGRVLVVTIADQEPKHAGPLVEVHDEVTGLLNHPNTVRVRGDAEQMYAAVATSITIST
jgi:hypothetical protein